MRKLGWIILCIIGLLIINSNSIAQSKFTLTGLVKDKEQSAMPYATVVLLSQSDSTINSFSVTDKTGAFSILNVKKGNYILQASFVGFETYYKNYTVSKSTKLPPIILKKKNIVLSEVEVKAEIIPILIKGDTVEYNAAAFKTQAEAPVEELLKKLPGIEVQKDGSVKAQGEDVVKILVDGKEFFGNDAKVATKNLPAKAIDKVQVYDKQSDLAEFTGVDDGDRLKTINLKLKDDHKNGIFGNVKGGIGNKELYNSKLNLNKFTAKSQISLLGMSNNINEQGFSFEDYLRFIGGFNNLLSGGGMNFNLDGGMPLNFGGNNGINSTNAVGLNFNKDFSKKTELYSSYFFTLVDNETKANTFREYLDNESNFDYSELSDNESKYYSHRANIKLKHSFNKKSQLEFKGNLGYNDAKTAGSSDRYNYKSTGELRAFSKTNDTNDGNGLSGDGSLKYRRKLNKKGRYISISSNAWKKEENRNKLLNIIDNLYVDSIQMFSHDSTFQRQKRLSDNKGYKAHFTYNEPLSSKLFLEFKISRQESSYLTDKGIFERDLTTNDEIFDFDLSNKYEKTYSKNQAGFKLKRISKKTRINFSAFLENSELSSIDLTNNNPIKRSYLNFVPIVGFQHDFSNKSRFDFNYISNINEPEIEQLQPIIDNSNPFNLYIGNPNLKPEKTHNANLNYMFYSQFSFTSWFVSFRSTLTENKIVESFKTDSLFRRTTSPINSDKSNYYFSLRSNFSTPIRKLKTKIGMNISSTLTSGNYLQNDVSYNSNRYTNTFGVTIENRKKDNFDLLVGNKTSFNQTIYQNSESLNRNYYSTNYYIDFKLFIKNWTLTTSVDNTYYIGDVFKEDANIIFWKAALQYSFLKRKFKAEASIVDVLNKDNGLSRNSALSYIEQTNMNTLGRYFMFTLYYNISSFGGNNEPVIKVEKNR